MHSKKAKCYTIDLLARGAALQHCNEKKRSQKEVLLFWRNESSAKPIWTYVIAEPIQAQEFLQKLSSGSVILLMITMELRMNFQNIWRRVVGNVLNNMCPSNIFPTLLLPSRFHQNLPAAFDRGDCYWVNTTRVRLGIAFHSVQIFSQFKQRLSLDLDLNTMMSLEKSGLWGTIKKSHLKVIQNYNSTYLRSFMPLVLKMY